MNARRNIYALAEDLTSSPLQVNGIDWLAAAAYRVAYRTPIAFPTYVMNRRHYP